MDAAERWPPINYILGLPITLNKEFSESCLAIGFHPIYQIVDIQLDDT